jgi:hypothetical protein
MELVGILSKHGKVFTVRVPDLPQAVGTGPTVEAAVADATAAANEFAWYMASYDHIWRPHNATQIEAGTSMDEGKSFVTLNIKYDVP